MSILSEENRSPFAQPLVSKGILLVAHGSRDPKAADVAFRVARGIEARSGQDGRHAARAAFIELAEPEPETALDELRELGVEELTVVPFLLGQAYHAKVDLPKVVKAARERGMAVRLSRTLGPDPLLTEALNRRIIETGHSFDALVLAAAGSSDPEGNAGVFATAEELSARFGVPVTAGFASATQPEVDVAVRLAEQSGAVLVATYLLAPGFFARKIRRHAVNAGAVAVTDPLGADAEIVELVLQRAGAADLADSATALR